MDNVDQRLVDLCRRDEIIALRDRAKRAAEQGDEQAGFVWAWMDQALQARTIATTATTTAVTASSGQRRR